MSKRNSGPRVGSLPAADGVLLSADDPSSASALIGVLRRDKGMLERELGRVKRELDLVKGKSEVKVSQLEEALSNSNAMIAQLKSDVVTAVAQKQKTESEMQLLQESIIDQASEISSLKTRQKCMDQEMARKDKDAQELMTAVRRYKTRVDYLKSKLRRSSHRRNSKSDYEESNSTTNILNGSTTINGSIHDFDQSPIGGRPSSLMSASVPGGGRRRDSIPFPGYMTSEEEYFRLVLLAAKLNAACSSGCITPNMMHETFSEGGGSGGGLENFNEITETEFDPKLMYSQIQLERVPFHKWHEWAQDYIITHHMPPLMGVDSSYPGYVGERSQSRNAKHKKKMNFAQKVARGTQQILIRILPRKKQRHSSAAIGVAAGGEWED